jgi:hypothetical protein
MVVHPRYQPVTPYPKRRLRRRLHGARLLRIEAPRRVFGDT